MRQVDGVVGNVEADPEIAQVIEAHERDGSLERVVLDDTERRRSRLRVTTEAGTELGVLVDRPELVAGDVLLIEDDLAVVVAFDSREAFVIEFPAPEAAVSTAVELGHRIGNQHWDISVDGSSVYVPVEADRAIIEDVLGPYIPAGATTRYETVEAERFIDKDGDRNGGHDHGHGHGHNHDNGHDHDRSSEPEGTG
jgi:urease accessory protein